MPSSSSPKWKSASRPVTRGEPSFRRVASVVLVEAEAARSTVSAKSGSAVRKSCQVLGAGFGVAGVMGAIEPRDHDTFCRVFPRFTGSDAVRRPGGPAVPVVSAPWPAPRRPPCLPACPGDPPRRPARPRRLGPSVPPGARARTVAPGSPDEPLGPRRREPRRELPHQLVVELVVR